MRFFPLFDNRFDLRYLLGAVAAVRVGSEQLDKAVVRVFAQILAQAVALFGHLGLELAD